MPEQETYRTQLKFIQSTPPGYMYNIKKGALCQVTTKQIIITGGQNPPQIVPPQEIPYQISIPLDEIRICEINSDDDGHYLEIHTKRYWAIYCNSLQETLTRAREARAC